MFFNKQIQGFVFILFVTFTKLTLAASVEDVQRVVKMVTDEMSPAVAREQIPLVVNGHDVHIATFVSGEKRYQVLYTDTFTFKGSQIPASLDIIIHNNDNLFGSMLDDGLDGEVDLGLDDNGQIPYISFGPNAIGEKYKQYWQDQLDWAVADILSLDQ